MVREGCNVNLPVGQDARKVENPHRGVTFLADCRSTVGLAAAGQATRKGGCWTRLGQLAFWLRCRWAQRWRRRRDPGDVAERGCFTERIRSFPDADFGPTTPPKEEIRPSFRIARQPGAIRTSTSPRSRHLPH